MNAEGKDGEAGSPFLTKAARFFGKLLAAAVILLACAAALLGIVHYRHFSPGNLPPDSAGEYTRLEPGDKVLRAYTGLRWLDSQRYFVIQADPASFDARIALSAASPGAVVSAGSGKDLYYPSEKLPAWWDVSSLDDLVAVDVGSGGSPHNGERRFYSKSRGLIYVVDR